MRDESGNGRRGRSKKTATLNQARQSPREKMVRADRRISKGMKTSKLI